MASVRAEVLRVANIAGPQRQRPAEGLPLVFEAVVAKVIWLSQLVSAADLVEQSRRQVVPPEIPIVGCLPTPIRRHRILSARIPRTTAPLTLPAALPLDVPLDHLPHAEPHRWRARPPHVSPGAGRFRRLLQVYDVPTILIYASAL